MIAGRLFSFADAAGRFQRLAGGCAPSTEVFP
jgi:hypothetical protein